MPRKRKTRLYLKRGRYYGDFRDYSDVGGGKEAVIAPGTSAATTDETTAAILVAERLKELERARRDRTVFGHDPSVPATFLAFARLHLENKARDEDVTDEWMEQAERHLKAAVKHFGVDRTLASVTPKHVKRYARWLLELPNGRGSTLSGGTVRQYLNSLSNMFEGALEEECPGVVRNPVRMVKKKPKAEQVEAAWFEIPEAALFLRAAKTLRRKRPDLDPLTCTYALVATYLLTGGREDEVLGLELADVNFERKSIRFRPNRWRRLKNKQSIRTIRMSTQLEEILQEYLAGPDRPNGHLLFPAWKDGQEQMIKDTRKALDAVAERAGWKRGEIRTRRFRHTFCAARLQSLDDGRPVSEYTVGKELGHGGATMVKRVYGHLGQFRHRGEGVAYHLEEFREVLGERLRKIEEEDRAA